MKGDEKWLSEAFSIIESPLEMEAVIAKLRDFLEIDHLVYHSSKMGASPSVEPYIRLTYPASWIKRYLQMGYVDIDPVVREGFLRTLPFAWSELSGRWRFGGGKSRRPILARSPSCSPVASVCGRRAIGCAA